MAEMEDQVVPEVDPGTCQPWYNQVDVPRELPPAVIMEEEAEKTRVAGLVTGPAPSAARQAPGRPSPRPDDDQQGDGDTADQPPPLPDESDIIYLVRPLARAVSLVTGVQARSPGPRFPCQCGKVFSHRSGLSRHKNTHKGIKYRCPKCSARLGRSDSLTDHMRRHHGVL